MTKIVINKGGAGLGNRLITAAAAIEYAISNNRALLVDWSDGVYSEKGKNIFHQYFSIKDIAQIASLEEIEEQTLTYYPPKYKNKLKTDIYSLYRATESWLLQKSNRFNPKGTFGKLLGYWQSIENFKTNIKDIDAILALFRKNDFPYGGFLNNRKEDVVIFSDFYPKYDGKILRHHIALKDNIKSKIEHFQKTNNLSKGVVGVHVRNTDKTPTAPLSQLFEKINKITKKSSAIFLATNSIEIELEFKKRYTTIIMHPKNYPPQKNIGTHHYAIRTGDYSSAEQLLEASIIDMYLLSKCDYLIYQKNSSFSEVSAALKAEPERTLYW